jgi:hypothetical protein
MPRKSKHSLSILHHLAGSKLFLKVAGVFTFTNSWSNTASATKSGATFPTRGSENSRDCSTAQKQRNKSGTRDKITHIRKLTELLQTLQHWSQFLVTVPFFSCIQQKPRSLGTRLRDRSGVTSSSTEHSDGTNGFGKTYREFKNPYLVC